MTPKRYLNNEELEQVKGGWTYSMLTPEEKEKYDSISARYTEAVQSGNTELITQIDAEFAVFYMDMTMKYDMNPPSVH